LATYLNAILSVYDPHTEYYPPKNKEDFDIRFSGQLEGIGATLTQKEGFITVTDVKIGSPAWKQGELEVNDKILKVTQGNTKESTDVVDMRLDKAIRFIRGPKGTEVILTIQKVDGTQKTISLLRDVIVIEETYAKSMVLTDRETYARVGYIYLPSFYANFQDRAGRRSSVDVKNEIEKLKAENVSGIIIDLRSNTGGSLMDCVDIAGHFIDQGPVVQVQGRGKPPQVLSDTKSGTVWDGPLVVLVNSYSASASEIFAAAMQDYGRAIIMGSTTYGKGTVQRFDDLDRLVMGQNDIKPLGSLKLTIQKFYRINGSSTQLRGVTPDITIPDSYKYMDTGERELNNALAWSEISTSTYSTWMGGVCKWDNAVRNSNERIAKSAFFALTNENAERLKQRRDETRYPLNYETYKKFIEQQNNEAEKYKNLGKDTLNMTAQILTNDETINPSDTAAIERNKKWNQMIITDNTIFEAMQVVQEMKRMRCFATRRDD
jgi:carboxyl-terminal processing protease